MHEVTLEAPETQQLREHPNTDRSLIQDLYNRPDKSDTDSKSPDSPKSDAAFPVSQSVSADTMVLQLYLSKNFSMLSEAI
jgi:hypothetical protein